MSADDVDLWVSGLQAITTFYMNHQAVIQIHMEGILMKRGGPLKAWKKRFCVLRTDALYYYTGENQQMKGKIPLLHACVFDTVLGVNQPHTFQVISSSKKYIMSAPTELEKEAWIRNLRDQIKLVGVDVDSIDFE